MESSLACRDKRQRHSDHRDEPIPKLRKKSIKKKITNVNQDCLELICDKLDIADLLRVANSNSWLKLAAVSVFGRKFSQLKVLFTDIYPKYHVNFKENRKIVVGGLKTCLQFLRCFGEHMKILEISFVYSNEAQHSYIDEYIIKFCKNSLVELKVYGRLSSLMTEINTPFPGE